MQDESDRGQNHNHIDDATASSSRQSEESELSISKMVTSIPQVPNTVNAAQKNGVNATANTNPSAAAPSETEEEEEGSMERLIARWCQLQDVTSKPRNDMLSSTLIMLQLQKLERRVENLSNTLVQQQTSMQSDITRILSFVSASANSQNVNSTGTTQVMVPNSSYHTANHDAAGDKSAVSALSSETQSTLNSRARNQGYPAAAMIATTPRQEVAVSPPAQFHQTADNTRPLHPSSVFTSVRTVERQPPRPPRRHDSASSMSLSVSRGTGNISSRDLSNTSSSAMGSISGAPPQLPPPAPESAQTSSALSSMVTDPKVVLNKSKSKSSFRNSKPDLEIIWDASDHTSGQSSPPKQSPANTTPSSRSSLSLRFNKDRKRAPPKLANLSFEDDDDDTVGSQLFSGMKTYMELAKSNENPHNASGLMPALVNHDSCLSGVSFMEDTDESNSNLNDSNLMDSQNTNLNEMQDTSQSTDADFPAGRQRADTDCSEALVSAAETTDADDDDTTVSSSTELLDGNKKDKKSKKQKKQEKKEKKKKKKKDKKNSSIRNNKVSPSRTEEKEKKKRGRGRRISKILWKRSSKKTGETTKSSSGSEASSPRSPAIPPTIPPGQPGTGTLPPEHEFSVYNDNPRTHLMPTASTVGLTPISPTTEKKPMVERTQTDATAKTSNTGTSTDAATAGISGVTSHSGDHTETMTVKTPMTAKTPMTVKSQSVRTTMTAKTPIDAIQSNIPMEPPPPPTQEKQNRYRSDLAPPSLQPGHKNTPNDTAPVTSTHPPSPPPRRRAPFPRTRGMMPSLVNSKREIIVGTGESSRMQISTLTLDTALPSVDAGSVLHEVTHQIITDKCKERGTYTGTVNESEEPDGYGTMIYMSGAFYKGHWKEGHWHGNGILRTPNGDSYEGDFVYDCRHGRGIYKYENGDVFEGDFSSDKRHGKGTFLFQNGSMFRGDFAYGNFHGYGWYEFEEGYYEGSWVDGVYEGIGSLIYKDGSHYTGRFKGGAADGMGEEKKTDGTSKRGMWRDGEFIGQMEQIHPDQPNLHDSLFSV